MEPEQAIQHPQRLTLRRGGCYGPAVELTNRGRRPPERRPQTHKSKSYNELAADLSQSNAVPLLAWLLNRADPVKSFAFLTHPMRTSR